MAVKRMYVKTERTPEELAELRAVREYYQTHKPSLAEVLKDSDQDHPMTLGEYMLLRQIFHELKQERERQNLTLADLEARTKINQATLSRLETGKAANPTIESICRIASALGKTVNCFLTDTKPAH